MTNKTSEIIHNIAVGLAVSIVMLNLGVALGILSGRGAFAGMLSAGVIAFITSAFGGTRIQGSGSTAPMSTVTAVIVAYASENIPKEIAGIEAHHFVNIVIMMTGVLLILFSILKLGRFIAFVPKLVISGFMCGIAIIIWYLQIDILLGIDRDPIEGNMILNILVAICTLVIAFFSPLLFKKIIPRFAGFFPGTLIALIIVSFLANILSSHTGLHIGYLNIENTIDSPAKFFGFLYEQIPTFINADILLLAFPYALKLAALCYIDTLLTSLIVDKMRGTKTRQNKELAAQGIATSFVSLLGGVPGAQSTVPSVLIVKEGATTRLAGMCAGIFVIAEMMMLADFMNYIPQAVFAGILMKVGYDVFDFMPLWAYARNLKKRARNLPAKIVGHKEMTIISGTALATAFIDLILAVSAFTAIFHIYNRIRRKKKNLRDYVPD